MQGDTGAFGTREGPEAGAGHQDPLAEAEPWRWAIVLGGVCICGAFLFNSSFFLGVFEFQKFVLALI